MDEQILGASYRFYKLISTIIIRDIQSSDTPDLIWSAFFLDKLETEIISCEDRMASQIWFWAPKGEF